MPSQWYFRQDGHENGPYTSSQLKRLVQSGHITDITEVRRGQDGKWVQANRVSGLITSEMTNGKNVELACYYSHNFVNRKIVHYTCPKCGLSLNSPLSDAGKPDSCPDCRTRFVVPGMDALMCCREKQAIATEERNQKRQAERTQKAEGRAAAKKIASQQLVEKQRRESEKNNNTNNTCTPHSAGPEVVFMHLSCPAINAMTDPSTRAAEFRERLRGWP
jgi:Zn-finger nucleic acid-binding protein